MDESSTGSPVATYTYDGQNRRSSETVNGTTTKFFYQGTSDLVSYTTDGSGNLLQTYTYGENDEPISLTTWSNGSGTTYYYHENTHGDVIALTDSSGNIVAQYTYDAWGNILSKSGTMADSNPYRYAGYRWDDAVGMYYLNARYYKPDIMRFISQDPVDGMNLYAYCDDNPINKVDPSGEWSLFGWYDGGFWGLVSDLTAPFGGEGAAIGEAGSFIRMASRGSRIARRGLNFAETAAGHMEEPHRYVPVHIQREIIRSTRGVRDERGSRAKTYYGSFYKWHARDRRYYKYKIKIVYHRRTNTVYHFHYWR